MLLFEAVRENAGPSTSQYHPNINDHVDETNTTMFVLTFFFFLDFSIKN
jgi:hypothetical protein